jgi:phospholipase/carboxylesterase
METDRNSGMTYRLLGAPAAPALVVLLHGIRGSENQLERLTPAFGPGCQCALVRAPVTLSPGAFAWFEATFTPERTVIDAAQAEASRLQLALLVAALQTRTGIGPARTVIAGFSQGGIMSAGLALTRPELVAGFGLLSGRILAEIAPHLASREQLARIAGFVAHGDRDDTLPVALADRAEAWLRELGVPFASRRYPAGHELPPEMIADFSTWLRDRVGLTGPGQAPATAG